MENKFILYSIEQCDDVRYYIAPDGCTPEDLFKAANSERPFLALMDFGEEIPIEKYAEIQQSESFAGSVEFDFDTSESRIYEVNGGKGGIAEDDRTDDNVRFTDIRISEYVQSAKLEETAENAADKTFAYEVGHSAPFAVVHLDISMEGRRNAVSEALKDIIDAYYTDGRQSNDMAQPYKNLLEQIKPEAEFIHASQGHLSCLKYALRYAETDKELCLSMLDSIKRSENNPTAVVIIKGYECIPKDKWEDHGVTYSIGQSVDDPSFYYARATDGKITRDYEYDHEPSRENVMSDHADKLAEEAIDRYEAVYAADGNRVFPDNDEDDGEEFEP